jgi:hypothetical protein
VTPTAACIPILGYYAATAVPSNPGGASLLRRGAGGNSASHQFGLLLHGFELPLLLFDGFPLTRKRLAAFARERVVESFAHLLVCDVRPLKAK